MRLKIVIVGGTGFVGQGIIKQLPSDKFEIHSLSRHSYQPLEPDDVTYHVINLAQPEEWRSIAQNADWIIDAVGILFPNPIKHQNYHNSSYKPAKYIIDMLTTLTNPKFLFISANAGPFFMKPYLRAKRTVETEMTQSLNTRAYIVYPGIIFDKSRLSSYFLGLILSKLTIFPYFKRLRPISRDNFSVEIENTLIGGRSDLEEIIT